MHILHCLISSIVQLLAFMHAQFTFFHQGYDLLKEFDPFMKKVAGQVDLMRKEGAAVSKDMESRHSLVSPKHLQVCVCMYVCVYISVFVCSTYDNSHPEK